jgi:hypothetical protein
MYLQNIAMQQAVAASIRGLPMERKGESKLPVGLGLPEGRVMIEGRALSEGSHRPPLIKEDLFPSSMDLFAGNQDLKNIGSQPPSPKAASKKSAPGSSKIMAGEEPSSSSSKKQDYKPAGSEVKDSGKPPTQEKMDESGDNVVTGSSSSKPEKKDEKSNPVPASTSSSPAATATTTKSPEEMTKSLQKRFNELAERRGISESDKKLNVTHQSFIVLQVPSGKVQVVTGKNQLLRVYKSFRGRLPSKWGEVTSNSDNTAFLIATKNQQQAVSLAKEIKQAL